MVYTQDEGISHPTRVHELLECLMSNCQLRCTGTRNGDGQIGEALQFASPVLQSLKHISLF